MSRSGVALVVLAMLGSVAAADGSAGDIIKKEGRFVFVDGSSYYAFAKDGTFDSGPMGMSGREIHGKWTSDGSYIFTVEGVWTWMNGASAKDDRRVMKLGIEPPFTEEKLVPAAGSPDLLSRKGAKVYHCYFIVEELSKLPATPAGGGSSAADIIKKEGQLLVTDKVSYYQLDRDGTFDSGPLDDSGVTIHGKWKAVGSKFVVEGNWGRINGISPKNDPRRLTLSIASPCTEVPPGPRKVGTASKLYRCTVTLIQTVKLPAGK